MSDAEGQPRKRITLSLPLDVYKAVKVFGAHTVQTNQAILEAALSQYMASSAQNAETDKNEWFPIETAPKDGSYIIAWAEGAVPTVIVFRDDFGWCGRTARDEEIMVKFPPTHWTPLPLIPAALKGGEE